MKDRDENFNKSNTECILIPLGISGKAYFDKLVKQYSTHCYYVPRLFIKLL